MPCEYRMIHRVEFADTDMAGIIHFSSYFRYMEVTEHAFFRSLGLSIDPRRMGLEDGGRLPVGWPRVRVSCDFRRPLRFEDEVEAHLLVREKGRSSITYEFIFRQVNDPKTPEVARGSLTVVCAAVEPESGELKAVPIPDAVASRIEVAP